VKASSFKERTKDCYY